MKPYSDLQKIIPNIPKLELNSREEIWLKEIWNQIMTTGEKPIYQDIRKRTIERTGTGFKPIEIDHRLVKNDTLTITFLAALYIEESIDILLLANKILLYVKDQLINNGKEQYTIADIALAIPLNEQHVRVIFALLIDTVGGLTSFMSPSGQKKFGWDSFGTTYANNFEKYICFISVEELLNEEFKQYKKLNNEMEAKIEYKLNDYHRNTTEEELLDDIRGVANKLKTDKLKRDEYQENGKYSSGTMERRFGSWNKALEKAGIRITLKRDIPEKELFENIEDVWIKLGRQPLSKEIKQPLSKYSERPYINKFGTMRKALEAFVKYINSDEEANKEIEEMNSGIIQEDEILYKHTTKRNINERLKVQVLMRDGNKCKLCGITVTGENIHFDHIKPWSKGGETVLENLQVLCARHNIAKGNIEYKQK